MSFITLGEKAHAVPIKQGLLEWNPAMDVVAMISDADEICLNRLSGQRVWATSPFFGTDAPSVPTSLTWRADGKVLAVGFANGHLLGLDLQDGHTITRLQYRDGEKIKQRQVLKWLEGKYPEIPAKERGLRLDIRTKMRPLASIPARDMYANLLV